MKVEKEYKYIFKKQRENYVNHLDDAERVSLTLSWVLRQRRCSAVVRLTTPLPAHRLPAGPSLSVCSGAVWSG